MNISYIKEIVTFSKSKYNDLRSGNASNDILLLLNLCWGMIVLPGEYNKTVGGRLYQIDLNNGWGVDESYITPCSYYNVKDVIMNLRDAICHNQFSFNGETEYLTFYVNDGSLSSTTFELNIPFKDFESFVLSFADYFLREIK